MCLKRYINSRLLSESCLLNPKHTSLRRILLFYFTSHDFGAPIRAKLLAQTTNMAALC